MGEALEIIGVVETVPSSVRAADTDGVAYFLDAGAPLTIVRLAPGDLTSPLEQVDATLKALAPSVPPVGRVFLTDAFDNVYRTFTAINRVFTGLALFAITIAGIGLYGMASYMTTRRTREIGLRKTQGASSAQILKLLLRDFSEPVLLANVLVWPIAYVVVNRYLAQFAEPIVLTPWPFIAALAGTLAVAWLAVAGHALRAANVRPTEALRHE